MSQDTGLTTPCFEVSPGSTGRFTPRSIRPVGVTGVAAIRAGLRGQLLNDARLIDLEIYSVICINYN